MFSSIFAKVKMDFIPQSGMKSTLWVEEIHFSTAKMDYSSD